MVLGFSSFQPQHLFVIFLWQFLVSQNPYPSYSSSCSNQLLVFQDFTPLRTIIILIFLAMFPCSWFLKIPFPSWTFDLCVLVVLLFSYTFKSPPLKFFIVVFWSCSLFFKISPLLLNCPSLCSSCVMMFLMFQVPLFQILHYDILVFKVPPLLWSHSLPLPSSFFIK
jgi:hypothetical protein